MNGEFGVGEGAVADGRLYVNAVNNDGNLYLWAELMWGGYDKEQNFHFADADTVELVAIRDFNLGDLGITLA